MSRPASSNGVYGLTEAMVGTLDLMRKVGMISKSEATTTATSVSTAARVSDPPDASTAQRIALLYAADERCRDHARRIAIGEARRVAGCELSAPLVDVESRAKGPEVHLSLNVEAQRRNG